MASETNRIEQQNFTGKGVDADFSSAEKFSIYSIVGRDAGPSSGSILHKPCTRRLFCRPSTRYQGAVIESETTKQAVVVVVVIVTVAAPQQQQMREQ